MLHIFKITEDDLVLSASLAFSCASKTDLSVIHNLTNIKDNNERTTFVNMFKLNVHFVHFWKHLQITYRSYFRNTTTDLNECIFVNIKEIWSLQQRLTKNFMLRIVFDSSENI